MYFYLLTSVPEFPMWHAERVLLHLTLSLQQQKFLVLDYLLEPESLEVLLCCPTLLTCSNQMQLVEQEHLLSIISHLGRKGTAYRYSGSYELFHTSSCISLLGKTGCPILPLALDVIIAEKRRYSTTKLPIACDEIA
jgi:hypothetical protein